MEILPIAGQMNEQRNNNQGTVGGLRFAIFGFGYIEFVSQCKYCENKTTFPRKSATEL